MAVLSKAKTAAEEATIKAEQAAITAKWQLAYRVLSVTDRAILYGPPGTGKTTLAVEVARDLKIPFFVQTLTEDTPSQEGRGHYIPKGGEFIWQDGIYIRAWREGGMLILNEINRASEEVRSILYAITDKNDGATLTLPTGETVTPHPNFRIIATMNGTPEQELNDALLSRFPVRIHMTELRPEALNTLPPDLRNIAAGTVGHPDLKRRTDVRMWLAFAHIRKSLGIEDAAAACFGQAAQSIIDSLKMAASE